jgi:hypothetical protein
MTIIDQRSLMNTMRIPTRVASFVSAIVLMLLISPALADDPPNVELTYTKWVTISPGYPVMQGVVGGDIVGSFAGEVLAITSIANNKIFPIEALYNIHDGTGGHSFTAQIQGNENDTKGFVGATNTLDGTIIDGWRLGARVHVKYESFLCGEPNAFGGICYLGTIRIMPASAN